MTMLIERPTSEQWRQLRDNCLQTEEDMAHLNAFPYNCGRPTGDELFDALRHMSASPGCKFWLIEEKGEIVGFINFGSIIPWQHNAFGVVIGKRFARKGYARKALQELINRKSEFGITELNGYCNRRNTAIIKLMEFSGFKLDSSFIDRQDSEAIKYYCQGVYALNV